MADRAQPRPPAQPRPQPARPAGTQQTRQRESAVERRTRQTADAIATQADLKREAAERRASKKKKKSGS